ncbi:MAG: efflux RND transporter permease subunit, partial [bacterium]
MRLPELGIKRPITTTIFLASLLVVGAIAWRFIPLRLLPAGLDTPFLGIWIRYPNSSPEDNARMIVEPLEEELWTVKGIKQIRSRSDRERCGIWMEFYGTTDMNTAYLEVKERIERARPYLPSDLRHFFIRRFGDNESPVVWFTIVIEDKLEDPYRLIKDEVVDALQKIDGVAAVEMWGGDPREVRIELSMDKLKQFHIDINQVVEALRQADFALSAGTIYDGGTQFIVKSSGRLTNLEEIRELPIPNVKNSQRGVSTFTDETIENRNISSNPYSAFPSRNFHILKLKEIGEVHYSPPPRQWVQRM